MGEPTSIEHLLRQGRSDLSDLERIQERHPYASLRESKYIRGWTKDQKMWEAYTVIPTDFEVVWCQQQNRGTIIGYETVGETRIYARGWDLGVFLENLKKEEPDLYNRIVSRVS